MQYHNRTNPQMNRSAGGDPVEKGSETSLPK